MRQLEIVLRTVFVAYVLATYVLAMIVSGLSRPENRLWLYLAVAGLVWYIIAAVVLQLILHKERQPLWLVAVFVVYPPVTHYLQFSSMNLASLDFWCYAGWAYFLVICGGFILGIVLSPAIARLRGASGQEVSGAIAVGREHIARHGWKGITGALALIGLMCAPIALGAVFGMRHAGSIAARESGWFAAYAALGAAIMLVLTYRNTLFSYLARLRHNGRHNSGNGGSHE